MTALESQRHTAVFGVACFGIDATENTGVGTCDAENTCRGREVEERVRRERHSALVDFIIDYNRKTAGEERVGIAYLYIEMYKAKKLRAPWKYSMGCDYTTGRLRPQTMFIFYGQKSITGFARETRTKTGL